MIAAYVFMIFPSFTLGDAILDISNDYLEEKFSSIYDIIGIKLVILGLTGIFYLWRVYKIEY